MSYARIGLSESDSGDPILIEATSSPGTLLHDMPDGSLDWHEIYTWAANLSGSSANVTFELVDDWGNTKQICAEVPVPANEAPKAMLQRQNIQGPRQLRAYASTGNVLAVSGYVNKISQ